MLGLFREILKFYRLKMCLFISHFVYLFSFKDNRQFFDGNNIFLYCPKYTDVFCLTNLFYFFTLCL